MANTITSTTELSVQLLTADGMYSKLIKIGNPMDSLGGRSGVINSLKPLIADYQYTDGGQTHAMQGIFGTRVDGEWKPYVDFGTIEVTSKTVTKLG